MWSRRLNFISTIAKVQLNFEFVSLRQCTWWLKVRKIVGDKNRGFSHHYSKSQLSLKPERWKHVLCNRKCVFITHPKTKMQSQDNDIMENCIRSCYTQAPIKLQSNFDNKSEREISFSSKARQENRGKPKEIQMNAIK